MTHDPLCEESACGYCECVLIARVRANERERYECPMPCCDEGALQ